MADRHRHHHRHHRSRKPHPTAALVLRIVGFTALAGALGLGGFVAYQLWYTNVQADRAQGGLESQFAEQVQAAAPATGTYVPETLDLSPIVVPPALDTAAGLNGGLLPEEDEPPSLILETGPEIGRPMGTIVAPKAGIDWVVVEGSRLAELAFGAVHMPWTPMPGQPGNAVISGHRTTHGAPFRNIDNLVPGDIITVTTTIGTHTFQVVETRVVNPTETWVMDQWRGAWLTLTSCHPEFTATQRWVVISRLIDGPNAEAILGA